jgi:hypothetical protein
MTSNNFYSGLYQQSENLMRRGAPWILAEEQLTASIVFVPAFD